MATFTVIGLRDEDGDLTVAGVIRGEHNCVDTRWGAAGASRWASSFEAESAEDAERLARKECAED
jgi:hypothetical protein